MEERICNPTFLSTPVAQPFPADGHAGARGGVVMVLLLTNTAIDAAASFGLHQPIDLW